MITRQALTKIFLKSWGKSVDEANLKLYGHIWWQSNRPNKPYALRLSDQGFEFLVTTLELKAYEVPFTEPIELSPQVLIFLERYLDCPYYLTNFAITVFSEKRHFELYMFSDDIRKFGLIKAMSNRQSERDNEESD